MLRDCLELRRVAGWLFDDVDAADVPDAFASPLALTLGEAELATPLVVLNAPFAVDSAVEAAPLALEMADDPAPAAVPAAPDVLALPLPDAPLFRLPNPEFAFAEPLPEAEPEPLAAPVL